MLKPHHRHYLSGFFLDFGVMAAYTAMPFFIFDRLGGSAQASGIIAGSQAIAYGVGCLLLTFTGFPLARLGLRAAAMGATVFAVCFCGAAFVRNTVLYGALTTVAVAGQALCWPVMHAWIGADPNPRRRSRRMSRFNLSWSLGFAFGPFLGGSLYDLDYRLPFAAAFLLCSVTVVIFLLAPDERRYFGATADAPDGGAQFRHDRASERHLYAAWAANMVANALVLVTRSVYPKRVDDLVASGQLRFLFEEAPSTFLAADPATKFMWLAFVMSGANTLTFYLMGRTQWWHHRFSFLAGVQMLAALGFLALGFTRSLLVMLLCRAAVGMAWGSCFFAAVFYSVSNPALKHRRTAINEGAVGLGGFLGALAFGHLAGQFSLLMPFRYTPLFVGVAILAQIALLYVAALRLRAPANPSLEPGR